MANSDVRLRCLEMAIDLLKTTNMDAANVLKVAEEYYNFIMKL